MEEYAATLGLVRNPLFACAFSEKHLIPAIIGKISHDEWCNNVCSDLSLVHGESTAVKLVNKWRSLNAEIDYEFLNNIRSLLSNGRVVLVTNATSRLSNDLANVGLDKAFDEIVNSSEIGITKPDFLFFQCLLKRLRVKPKHCIFIDDTRRNVEAARALGIESLLHTSTRETLDFIKDKCT
nr:HAD-IA family hydrolase [Vibrio coralliilyticus]